jgi:hypothetical protein
MTRPTIEDRLELFLVYDRDPDNDNANVVSVCATADEARAEHWPARYPIVRAERGGFDTKRKIFNYTEKERIR